MLFYFINAVVYHLTIVRSQVMPLLHKLNN